VPECTLKFDCTCILLVAYSATIYVSTLNPDASKGFFLLFNFILTFRRLFQAMMNDESDSFVDDESYDSEATTSESSKSDSDVVTIDSDNE
jgi:hypothetical protein